MIWLFLGLFLILHGDSDADDKFFSSDGHQDTKEKEEQDETSLPATDSKLGHEFDPDGELGASFFIT
ncbi:hypothetical protein FGIG_02907 [Fasciola gigantica]|uniref:Uncharacterized protein n=1 Tax=Fasciola gigantica TaxID=46835 RepID=A0A504Z002_FASGI|nr:hypothetical protein FGIG_02907 [Fasciola gigantica]